MTETWTARDHEDILTRISEGLFRTFGEADWEAFSGAQGRNPQICYDDTFVQVIWVIDNTGFHRAEQDDTGQVNWRSLLFKNVVLA